MDQIERKDHRVEPKKAQRHESSPPGQPSDKSSNPQGRDGTDKD
jgi:hypothetical protein